MLCWCRHPTPKASSRSRSAWKLAGRLEIFFRFCFFFVSRFGTAFLRQNPPVPHSVTNLPWVFRGDSLMIFKTFPKTRRANRRPTSDFWEKYPTAQAFTPGIHARRWMKTTSIHQTRVTKKELSWKYYGKLMEILWTFSSDHISSTLYLVLSVLRKCCK